MYVTSVQSSVLCCVYCRECGRRVRLRRRRKKRPPHRMRYYLPLSVCLPCPHSCLSVHLSLSPVMWWSVRVLLCLVEQPVASVSFHELVQIPSQTPFCFTSPPLFAHTHTHTQEKAREEKQSEVANRIKEALNCGLKVLDDAFEKVEVPNTPGQLIVT